MQRNLFIAFEGIDGSGKETQMHLLVDTIRSDSALPKFGNKYTNIWITREPTRITAAGRKVAELIRDTKDKGQKLDGKTTQDYFVQDRQQHSDMIAKQLEHSHVFCSRFDLSTFAYQKTQDPTLDFQSIYDSHGFAHGNCIVPNITILFDLEPEEALSRSTQRGSKHEIFETKKFLIKTRENYLQAIKWWQRKHPERKFLLISGVGKITEIQQDLISKLNLFYN